ncbi:MAG: hypothetical protein BGN99_13835 [Alphaproteobacteria bacterium 65-37]|nr:MAG: hypothetical protein BGN99_13835 [Alphaproteobacteria bacterium 65-37]
MVAVCVGHRLLKLDQGAQRIDGAIELGKRTIAGQFDHATAVAIDGGLYAFGKMRLEESMGATFVLAHQARVAYNVQGDDDRKSALLVGQWRILRRLATMV